MKNIPGLNECLGFHEIKTLLCLLQFALAAKVHGRGWESWAWAQCSERTEQATAASSRQ